MYALLRIRPGRKEEESMAAPKSKPARSVGQIVAKARKTVSEITVTQAKEELEQGHVGLVLDVREAPEWEQGHIPGAVLVPRGLLEWCADPTTPSARAELTARREARIIVACASGLRSLLATATLQSMGYTNVVSLAGGFTAWSKQGFPVEQAIRLPVMST
jgi:rhodanese-related sulfurtransferase